MSSSLYWAPPPTEVKDHSIDLKYEIGRYFDQEYMGESIDIEVGGELIPFLKGVMAVCSGSKYNSAKGLISAIEKYGIVKLYTRS